jgi:hypothetical protein
MNLKCEAKFNINIVNLEIVHFAINFNGNQFRNKDEF